jgi:Holliday junction resolvase RusA-like endonuclease
VSDELLKDLVLAKNGDIPSPSGEANFTLPGSPASVQSKKGVRESYLQSIRTRLKDIKYLLTGELMLDVTWFVPAKSRFETDAKADIDNCIKPIIDAFTGPEGLFIDDCQIRGLYICWRHIESSNERLLFEFKFQADQYSSKESLAFVKLSGGLCTPVNLNWPNPAKALWAGMLTTNEKSKEILEKLGAPYPAVAGFLGGNQPFHRTRVNGFKVMSLKEFAFSGVGIKA